MADNLSFQSFVNYQVIATRIGDQSGQEFRAKLGTKPFLIGSGKKADLLLDGPRIIPIHVRLLISTSKQVMLSNLGGDNTILLNGEGITAYNPVVWKPGILLQMGDFELQLIMMTAEGNQGQIERVRPAIVTRSSEPVAEPAPALVIDWGDKQDILEQEANADTINFVDDTRQPISETTAEDVSSPVELEPSDDLDVLSTEVMPFHPTTASGTGSGIQETLPKDWKSAGKLRAQLPLHPVNLVAGERVRIPLSLWNDDPNPMELRLLVIGVPREWVELPRRFIELAPGELKTVDIILKTESAGQTDLEATIRVSDRQLPDATLMLPLHIYFKNAPNVTGRIEPPVVTAAQQLYLHLWNHTQSKVTIYISGHTEADELAIQPEQPQIDLPPGQQIRVPIKLRPTRRPWLKTTTLDFSVSARHTTRAPLDYPGVVRVRPRISPLSLVLLLVTLVGIGAVSLMKGSSIPDQVMTVTPSQISTQPKTTIPNEGLPSSHTPQVAIPATRQLLTDTSTPPATVPMRESTSTLSPTLDASATVSPTATLTTTAETPSFTDPRPDSCTVQIPPGWELYTVQAGDRAFRLAVNHHTTVEEIARVNCLSNPRLLQVGQILLLPPS